MSVIIITVYKRLYRRKREYGLESVSLEFSFLSRKNQNGTFFSKNKGLNQFILKDTYVNTRIRAFSLLVSLDIVLPAVTKSDNRLLPQQKSASLYKRILALLKITCKYKHLY
jgi:hypothetical protein